MRLFKEIRRRNVHRTAVAYAAGAWLVVQVAETLFPVFDVSEGAIRPLVIVLAIGFFVVVTLSWFFEWTAEGVFRDRPDEEPIVPRSTRTMDRVIVGILIVSLGYFAVDKFLLDPARDARALELARGVASSGGYSLPQRSIAVLPFVNMSSDPEQEYFADGMTEEILNLLAKIPELKVISRSTVFTFKGRNVAVPDVAAQLGVTHVLEGSIRKAGNQVRITAQLIDAGDDAHLWSETYDETLEDIFEIQNQISEQVVSELRLELLGQVPTADAIDPRAFDLYLQARHIVHTTNSPDQFEAARARLEQVIELEPDFLPGIYELARTHLRFIVSEAGADEIERIRTDIRALVDRMYEIAPDSSYTQGWKAYIAQYWENDLERSAFHRERAVEGAVDSNLYLQLSRAGAYLAAINRYEEAAAIAEFVIDRDPACTSCLATYSELMRVLGKSEEAAERLERTFEWQIPTGMQLYVLAEAWLYAGDYDKALHYFDQTEDPPAIYPHPIAALYGAGRRAEFEQRFAELRAAAPAAYGIFAALYAFSDQNDLAFEALEKWMTESNPGPINLVDNPNFYPLRSDPRWEPFVETHDLGRKDFSHILFNPAYPPEIEAKLAELGVR